MSQDSVSEYWNSLAARYRAGPLPGFLGWWRGELAGLLPQSVRQRLIPPRPALWLVPQDNGRKLAVWSGGDDPEKLDEFGADEDAGLLHDRWQSLAGNFREGEPEIRLCLPAGDVLQHAINLPLAVEANLDQALSYQLDQFTPFSADQVYFDYRIAGRDPEHGRLSLELRLVPVARIEELRGRLADIGIRPHAIDCLQSAEETPACEGFNLLPDKERPRYVYARARLNWILAGGVLLLLVAVMLESLYLREIKADRLRSEVDVLRTEAETVMTLQQRLEDALAAANFLAERRRRQPVVIQVLDEVTRILPEDTWLQQLQVRGDELMMQGLADGSQRLISLINDSELLEDAEFRGTVTTDPATGRDRFNVRASIQPRRTVRAAVAESGE